LADGTHASFDKHRNRFFLEGQGRQRKYHMVKWEDVCQPKSQGGLGVINSKAMNIALMAKWIWRILGEPDSDLLWLRLLKAKYNVKELFSSRSVAPRSGIASTRSRICLGKELDSPQVLTLPLASGMIFGLVMLHSV
jgi:hypothetical protein